MTLIVWDIGIKKMKRKIKNIKLNDYSKYCISLAYIKSSRVSLLEPLQNNLKVH